MRQRRGLLDLDLAEVDRLAGLGGELAAAEAVRRAGDQVAERHAAVGAGLRKIVRVEVEIDLVGEVAGGHVDVLVDLLLIGAGGDDQLQAGELAAGFVVVGHLAVGRLQEDAGRRRGPEPHRDRPLRRQSARDLRSAPEVVLHIEEVERDRLLRVAAGDLEPAVLHLDLRRGGHEADDQGEWPLAGRVRSSARSRTPRRPACRRARRRGP